MLLIGYENGKFLSYKDFLLSEGISPIKTEFGINTNINDRKTINKEGFIFTFLEIQEKIYVVSIRNDGYIGFGFVDITKDKFNLDIFKLEEILNLSSDNKLNNNLPGLKVFGKVFYVLLELFKTSEIDGFLFDSANKDLSNIYSYLPKNKYFNKKLDEIGLQMSVFKDSYFIKNKGN